MAGIDRHIVHEVTHDAGDALDPEYRTGGPAGFGGLFDAAFENPVSARLDVESVLDLAVVSLLVRPVQPAHDAGGLTD